MNAELLAVKPGALREVLRAEERRNAAARVTGEEQQESAGQDSDQQPVRKERNWGVRTEDEKRRNSNFGRS